jgi:olefin beta-lactone synthetase
MTTQTENQNISLLLTEVAARQPEKSCLIVANPFEFGTPPTYRQLSCGELERRVRISAHGLQTLGIGAGARVLMMIPPGFDLVTAGFALLRTGAVPVFIDEGMGLENMLRCIEEVEPDAVLSIARGFELMTAYPDAFKSVEKTVCIGAGGPEGSLLFSDLLAADVAMHAHAHKEPEDLSLILFTTGSTGTPKGVQYTPRVVRSQLEVMKRTWGLTEHDVDLSTFPTFVIGTIAIGMTVVVPDIDPSNPASADPRKIVQAIHDHQTTYTFGPPALWDKVTRYCIEHKIELPSMRNVLVAGAPVPAKLIRRFPRILPNGNCHTPIGATEANPITNITMQELIDEALPQTDMGKGVCVGYPLPGHEITVIGIDDGIIEDWSQARILGTGEIGEMVVSGSVVTHHYYSRPEATRKSKIYGGANGIAHRLGDTGFVDEKGRLWFCGRRAQVVQAAGKDWYPLQLESSFNSEADIWRSALVGVVVDDVPELALCIEFEPGQAPPTWRLPSERLARLQQKALVMQVPLRRFFACPDGFPVDIRHNSKINRPQLSKWVQTLLDDERVEDVETEQS